MSTVTIHHLLLIFVFILVKVIRFYRTKWLYKQWEVISGYVLTIDMATDCAVHQQSTDIYDT